MSATIPSDHTRQQRSSTSERQIVLPLILSLTLIAVVQAIQKYFLMFGGAFSSEHFLRMLVTSMIYYCYFLIPAFFIVRLVRAYPVASVPFAYVLLMHLSLLATSFFVHQTIELAADVFIIGIKWKSVSLVYTYFNNPAIWMEILMYGLFLLGIVLMDYRVRNQEHQLFYAEMEGELLQFKLQELRSKIHPPFLFHSLHTISQLLRRGENTTANHLLGVLSDFLRTTVYTQDGEDSTVDEEIETLSHYLEIEAIRLHTVLHVQQEISPDVHTALLPGFMLQLIVEDFMSHIHETEVTDCQLHIRIASRDSQLEIMVVQSIAPVMSPPRPSPDAQSPIPFIQGRLAQLYGIQQECTLQSRTSGHKEVLIRIPFRHR